MIPAMEPSSPMLEALDPDVRELCEADYDNNYSPIATYRQWRSVSDSWPILGLPAACLLALEMPERAAMMLAGMASIDVKDAIIAVKELGKR